MNINITSPQNGATFSPGQVIEVMGTESEPVTIDIVALGITMDDMESAEAEANEPWHKTITLPSTPGEFVIIAEEAGGRKATIKVIIQDT